VAVSLPSLYRDDEHCVQPFPTVFYNFYYSAISNDNDTREDKWPLVQVFESMKFAINIVREDFNTECTVD